MAADLCSNQPRRSLDQLSNRDQLIKTIKVQRMGLSPLSETLITLMLLTQLATCYSDQWYEMVQHAKMSTELIIVIDPNKKNKQTNKDLPMSCIWGLSV